MSNPMDVTRFLQAVFGADCDKKAIYVSGTYGTKDLERVRHHRALAALTDYDDCYWSIAAFPDDNVTSRTEARAIEVRALVVDDIGTKISSQAVALALGQPTAVVESSIGNYQWVYRLAKPVAVGDWLTFMSTIEALLGGLSGPVTLDGKDAVHMFRLPMGVNSKPGRSNFAVRLVTLSPQNQLDAGPVLASQASPGSSSRPGPGPAAGPGGANDRLATRALTDLVNLIPNDISVGREEWVEIGHAIKARCENDEEGFEIFDAWSAKWPGYDADNTRKAWDSFGAGVPLKSKGNNLLGLAEKLNPKGFEAWSAAQASSVFDDDEDIPSIAGAYRLTHMDMSEAIVAAERGQLGWIQGPEDWVGFDDVTSKWVNPRGDVLLRQAVRLEVEQRLALGTGKGAAQLRSSKWQSSIRSLMTRDIRLMFKPENFDANPDVIGTPGHVLEDPTGLGTLVERPGRAGDMITQATAVRPAPKGATSAAWQKFLSEFTGGVKDLELWWQVYCGYCLTGHTSEQILVFVHGPGGNGKSLFIDIISEAMGDYAMRADHRVFLEQRGAQHRSSVAVMEGKRLVTVSDIPNDAKWDMVNFRQLTGGGKVSANRMREDQREFEMTGKVIMAGNDKPRMDTIDASITRRMRLVPATFKPARVDTHLKEKLRRDLDKILRWMVDGLEIWLASSGGGASGLPACPTIEKATSIYIDDLDIWGRWKSECIERVPPTVEGRSKVQVRDLWQSWQSFRMAEGGSAASVAPNSAVKLGQRMRDEGYQTTLLGNVSHVLDIRLKKSAAGVTFDNDSF